VNQPWKEKVNHEMGSAAWKQKRRAPLLQEQSKEDDVRNEGEEKGGVFVGGGFRRQKKTPRGLGLEGRSPGLASKGSAGKGSSATRKRKDTNKKKNRDHKEEGCIPITSVWGLLGDGKKGGG